MQFILQKKSLIFSIIILIISFLVFFYLLKGINDNKDTTEVIQKEWQTEATYRDNIRFIANLVKNIEPQINSLETHFVQSSDVVPFLNTVEKLAKEVNAEAEVVSVNVAKDSPTLLVEMKAQGSFETIYKLITLLENSPYIIEFTSVDIQDVSTITNKNNEWTASLHMKLISFIK